MWTYYCYDDGKEADLWSEWYSSSDDRTQGAHDQTWDVLEQLEAHQWSGPNSKHLGKGLIEIFVRSDKQWRLLGYYGPKGERKAFTILLICYHKQKIYRPPNAIKTARKRLKAIESNKAGIRSCDRPR